MPQRLFYQLSLALPLIVPAILWLVPVPVLDGIDHDALVLGPLVASFPIAGIPYAIFAMAMAAWVQRAPARGIRRLSFVAPVLFLAVFIGWCAVRVGLQGGKLDRGFVGAATFFGIFVLMVGYSYVAIIELARTIAAKRRWISVIDGEPAA